MSPETEAAKPFIPYSITAQEETQRLEPNSQFVKVWRISFQTKDGKYHGTVEVPESEFNDAHVETLVQEKLDIVMAIHVLGDEPHPDNAAEEPAGA